MEKSIAKKVPKVKIPLLKFQSLRFKVLKLQNKKKINHNLSSNEINLFYIYLL